MRKNYFCLKHTNKIDLFKKKDSFLPKNIEYKQYK